MMLLRQDPHRRHSSCNTATLMWELCTLSGQPGPERRNMQHGRHTGATCLQHLMQHGLPCLCRMLVATLQPWRRVTTRKRAWNWWKQLKNLFTCMTFHMNIIFILAAVRTRNLTYYNICNGHTVNKLTYHLKYLILQTHLMNVFLPNKYYKAFFNRYCISIVCVFLWYKRSNIFTQFKERFLGHTMHVFELNGIVRSVTWTANVS
jgi:hypothetical protein